MSRKKTKHVSTPLPSSELAARIERAHAEGRTQQELELAKQLHRSDPTAAHLALLKRAYVARARHLQAQGHSRDAATVLEAGVAVAGSDRAWLAQAAQGLAAAGSANRALQILDALGESSSRGQVLSAAVDQAIRQGRAGREHLPANLHDGFDRILQAFARIEAGQDDAARDMLQPIGLQSPFLEWKVMLRGLAAYYQNDDERALENWQRLDPERLPARLVAPLRFGINQEYRAAQEPATQATLQKHLDRLQDVGIVQNLRAIRAALANRGDLTRVFRLAENTLAALRQVNPSLASRLATCFYWAMVDHGVPDDRARYRRVFGAPPDDPDFARLEGLITDKVPLFEEAHAAWKKYEQWVAGHPEAWPAGQSDRVRSLIWSHMGHNAASLPGKKAMAKTPKFLRDTADHLPKLDPGAVQCFERAIELAPDDRDPYDALLKHHLDNERFKLAQSVARRLLKQFPDDLPTLETLAGLRLKNRGYAEAVRLLERAMRQNPLDRTLPQLLSSAHLQYARNLTEKEQFDDARSEFQASLAIHTNGSTGVLCQWATCEFKAGNAARGDELVQEALAKSGSALATAYRMLADATRLKFPKELKQRFEHQFLEALKVPPTAKSVIAAAEAAAELHNTGIAYVGQKKHQQRVLSFIGKARTKVEFTDEQLEALCRTLLSLNATTLLQSFTRVGERRFPTSPVYPFLDARSYLPDKIRGRRNFDLWHVEPALHAAKQLLDRLPPGDRRCAIREEIQELSDLLGALSPLGEMFDTLMNTFGRGSSRDDWDDDDTDEWDTEDEYFQPFGRARH